MEYIISVTMGVLACSKGPSARTAAIAAVNRGVPKLVVCCALLVVAQHLIRVLDVSELACIRRCSHQQQCAHVLRSFVRPTNAVNRAARMMNHCESDSYLIGVVSFRKKP